MPNVIRKLKRLRKKTNTVRNQRRGKRRRRAETSGSALLEEVRHPKVREFAMRQLDGNLISDLPLFIKNFKKSDEELLTNPVKSVRVYFDGIDWHSIFSEVIFMSDDKLKAPAELLRYLYKKTIVLFAEKAY